MGRQWTTFVIHPREPGIFEKNLFQLSFVGYSKLVAAFGTAAGQYLATIGRLHTLAKTMYRFAAAIMWLKCTFHKNYFFLPEYLKWFLTQEQQSPSL